MRWWRGAVSFLFWRRSARVLAHASTIESVQAYSTEQLQNTAHLPRSVFCPITNMPMCDPVVTCDGFSYERDAIERWFKHKRTSPSTGKNVGTINVLPNYALRGTICELMAQQCPEENIDRNVAD
jgi:hypothetical protein